ncbi:MAG: sugar phosphate isomerase/epimerase, partial [Planctomycetes bacterium]|nr:sugar phosphate isomerase/epimerase [Planctomycetota bacterium]
TVSLVQEARGGPFVFWHDLPGACRTAKTLGFDAVEVFPPSPDAVAPATLRKLLDDNGLALAAVGTGAGWVKQKLHLTLPDPAARDRARAYIRAIIDFAGPFGAPAIIGSMQGRHSDEIDPVTAQRLLADALEELGEYARQYQVPLIFEPINRYETNLVNSLGTGTELLSALSTKNVRLLADLFHMNIEEVDSAAALRAAGALIGHVHFVDSNRRPAGLGHIDYRPIVAALESIGYTGFASAEALPYPDSDAAARQTIESFRKYFQHS